MTGLTNGTAYTFTVSATNSLGTGRAVDRVVSAVTPEDTIFDFGNAGHDRLRRPDVGQPRRQVHRGHKRPGHRHPLLQGGDEHGHPHRQPVDAPAARCWPRPRSPTRRPRAGRRSCSPAPWRSPPGTTYVASYFAPNGHYSYTSAAFNVRGRQPAAARRRQQRQRQRRLRLQRDAAPSRRSTYNASNYWVDVLFPPTPPGPGHERDRHRGPRCGDGQLDGPGRWRRHELHDDPVHRVDGPDADDRHRQPRRRRARRSPA